jgi:hypothetical protein
MEKTADGVVEPPENAPNGDGDAVDALAPLREPAGVPRTGAFDPEPNVGILDVKRAEAGVSALGGLSFPSPLS